MTILYVVDKAERNDHSICREDVDLSGTNKSSERVYGSAILP